MPHPSEPPGFLIIGAQKCGTTWLHRHLARHPDLWLPPEKELEFFSYTRHLDDPGLAAYRAQFQAAPGCLSGEATASYFWTASASPWCRQPAGFQPDIPAVVRRSLGPDLRLVVLLRDPLERALSAWAHYVAHGELDPGLPFEQAIHYGGVVDMGFYGRHFAAWRKHFGAERFLVLELEGDVVARPEATLKRTFRFLGCTPDIPPASVNDMADPAFPGLVRERADDGSVRVALGNDRTLFASAEALDTIAHAYAPDLERLRDLLGDPHFGRGWMTNR